MTQKKVTLKQLEERLVYLQSFIKDCVGSINTDDYHMAFFSKSKGKQISYEEIQEFSIEERYSMAVSLINDKDFFNGREGSGENIHKAGRVLYMLGFRELAADVNKLAANYYVSKGYQDEIEEIKHQIKQKKINSKGGKGRTSCHKDAALKIAADTWETTPGASMASLSVKIHAHINKKYRGIPEPDTIKEWLSKSGMNPNVTPKTKDYEIVVKC